jgi:L-ascorbate metabolism protein UlaG (beta-lactamase superfamily)
MELTWWGTAAFRIKTGNLVFLLDPYVSRNEKARPKQYLKAEDILDGELIFMSHGHFDHLFDVPVIARKAGSTVYCSVEAENTLIEKGLSKDKIHRVETDGYTIDFCGHQARAFFSEHVKFDKKLLFKTLLGINIRIFRYIPLLKEFPVGQVLSWRFAIEGKIIHFFGSGGSTTLELEKLASRPTDILLVPLQGHSNICDIALKYVRVMQPKIVIPHHQDDFFPPISSMVDIKPFMDGVKRECPHTEIRVLELNEPISL